MTTNLVTEMVGEGMLATKHAAERHYESVREDVEHARKNLADAQAALVEARATRKAARDKYEDEIRARRKPRQKNIVRRILNEVHGEERSRMEIVEATGLDATTVSSTLTRLRRAGFVNRAGDDYHGKWIATLDGIAFSAGDLPFPKEHRG
jgi:DNA-binding transcriptional ArsR family regulator